MTVTTKGYPTVRHKTPKIWPSVIAAILLLIGAAAPARAQSYTIMPSPFQAPLNDTGSLIVGGCVWTYAAGTTTPISTYTNTSGTTNSNPIIVDSTGRFTAYLLAGTTYKFVYETACTPPAHGAVLRTADNIAGTPAAAATVDQTCTAGEAISAGQAVYWSDGSGGKTPASCYKADSANTYSSTTPLVGLAPNAIASGAAGTVRLAGAVTGLSSLTVGTLPYYVGTAGAITTTAPTNARFLGWADTATSLIVVANPTVPAPPNADNGINDFRVSAQSGVPVPASDVTAATSWFCTPGGKGNRIALYNSSGVATVYTSAEFSIAVPATTSTTYDVFAFASGSTPTLELLAWRNSGQAITGATNATPIVITANAHGLSNGDEVYVSGVQGNTAANGTWTVANVAANTYELATSVGNGAYTSATGYMNARAAAGKLVLTTTGTYTKTADLTRRYLATVRTTTVSGQTEDSVTKRYVWNYYNRVRRPLQKFETTASWSYNGVVRQANGAATNQVDLVIGVAEPPISLFLQAASVNGGAGVFASIGIGEDSTTVYTVAVIASQSVANVGLQNLSCALNKVPAVGRHFYSWNEFASAGTNTFVGASASGGSTITPGLTGFIEGDD